MAVHQWFLWVLVPFALTGIFSKAYFILAEKFGLKERNYRGRLIPNGAGIVIPFVYAGMLPFHLVFPRSGPEMAPSLLAYLAVTFGLGIIGWLDDHFGERNIKGFRGHLKSLFKEGRLTSGLMKMVGAAVIGGGVSYFHRDSVIEAMFCTVLFGIWTNLLNLLDVRPTRAIKGFWLMVPVLAAVGSTDVFTLEMMISFISISVILFLWDSREKAMLGDAGANVLGGLLGTWMVMLASGVEIILFLLLGLWITLYSERHSISRWIDAHPLIRRIDGWGRKETG